MCKKIKMDKRLLSYLTIFCMILTLFPASGFAAGVHDIANHWAKDQIQSWINNDLVKGYPDGTFKPDNKITRAEFMVLVNGAFGYTGTSEIEYSDVKDSDWFADTVKKAKAAGYIGGYPDGTMKPNNPISREEAAAIIAKIKNLEEDASGANKFSDNSSMSWSKGAVGAVSKAAIMSGYPDGTFKPKNSIKRAEAVVALDKTLGELPIDTEIKEPADDSVVYDKAGTYGPEDGQEIVENDVFITVPGVTLRNMIIEGDLTISESVGEGEAYLKGVTVKGETIVNGGGIESIHLENTILANVVVNKVDGKVRIVVSGSTRVGQVRLQSGAKLEEKDLTGSGFESVKIEKGLPEDSKITLAGDFETVDIKAASIAVEIPKGIIQNLQVDKAAINTKINIARESEIIKAVIDAKIKVTGKGNVKEAEVNVKDVTFEKAPGKSTGTEKPKTSSSSGGGGGGGGSKSSSGGGSGGSSTPTKYSITVAEWVYEKAGVKVDKTTAAAGETVTISISDIKIEGKQLKSVIVTDANDKKVETKEVEKGSKYTFVMPARAVTIGIELEAVKEDPAEPQPTLIQGNFWTTGKVGIAPDTAGDAAGKIYIEYKLAVGEGEEKQDISLAEGNVKYIKVKVDDEDWKDLTPNTDATLWFNVESDKGVRFYEVKTKDDKVYTATLDWKKEIKTAIWEVTNREGEHEGKTYVEYKLMDDTKPISLKEGEVKLIASKADSKWVALEANTDATLWFNKAKATGNYDFFVVTSEGTMYKATLEYTAPADPTLAEVTTSEGLKEAIESKEVTTINVMNDILVTEKLNILSEKNINGNNYTLTANSPDGWDSFYVFHFYKTTGSVTDIKITGADAAIYVNGSEVTLNGTIDVSGNQFGGIEVSKGIGVSKEPKLTIADGTSLINGNEANAIPTIWEDQIGDVEAVKRVVGYGDMKVDYNQKTEENIQRFYYISAEFSAPNFVKDPAETYTIILSVKEKDSGAVVEDAISLVKKDGNVVQPTKGNPLIYELTKGVSYSLNVSKEGYLDYVGELYYIADCSLTIELEKDPKIAALAAINTVEVGAEYGKNNRQAMRTALQENAETLGLDLTEYNKITVDGRKDAVGWDLLANKPEGGYSIATLQSMLNEIVLTRQTTEKSMNLVNNAESLTDISFATMLLERFEAAKDENYTIHSGLQVADKINNLQGLKGRYEALDTDSKVAVLEKIIEKRPAGGYARSQATTDAFATALTEVEGAIVASKKAFYDSAQPKYEIYYDEVLVAEVEFEANTNSIIVRFKHTSNPLYVLTAGQGFFENVLQGLGVKSVSFDDEGFIDVDASNAMKLAQALFEEMGGSADDFNGKSADFTAKIQPNNHVVFQDRFKVVFYDESNSE